ncbi:phage tail assembly chaperone [Acinetobacter seifertii]|uniref:phage tail assembly chaperone n=1 Tax=Acinetobacter seifertii TaxID=1530123 RepID=UPI0032124550
MEINGIEYTIGRLNAVDQFHVSRKIAPIVPKLMPIIAEVAKGDLTKAIAAIEANEEKKEKVKEAKELGEVDENAQEPETIPDLDDLTPLADAFSPLMEVFASMPEEDVNFIIYKCLSVVKRGGAVVCRNNSIMFDNLGMTELLPLVIATIRINLGNFILGLLTQASSMQKQPQ